MDLKITKGQGWKERIVIRWPCRHHMKQCEDAGMARLNYNIDESSKPCGRFLSDK